MASQLASNFSNGDVEQPVSNDSRQNDSQRSPEETQPNSFGGIDDAIRTDTNLITWNGVSDREHPRNWPNRKKWSATMTVGSYSLITTMVASIVAPALGAISQDLHLGTDKVASQMVLSIYVLAWIVGQLILSPLSEIYGRVALLQSSNLFFLAFNIACGLAQTKSQMLAFRFLSGVGAGCAITLGAGILTDTWDRSESGKALGVYSLAPLLGPALGPVIGGFVTEHANWRWIFFGTSVASSCIQIYGYLFLPETFAPIVLRNKAKQLRKLTGNHDLYTDWEKKHGSGLELFKANVFRSFEFLATQPIIQVLALYLAYLYGLNFLALSTFSTLFKTKYHQSVSVTGLHYIFIGVGYFLGAAMAPVNGMLYNKMTKKNGGIDIPENRTLIMLPSSLLVPIGFLWYGWTAQSPNTHWILPDIGAVIFSAGIIVNNQSIIAYVIDCYPDYAASAMAAALMWRCVAAFAFPLFAPAMYKALDYGWGNSLLALIALGIGIPAPALLYRYGASLRKTSSYAYTRIAL